MMKKALLLIWIILASILAACGTKVAQPTSIASTAKPTETLPAPPTGSPTATRLSGSTPLPISTLPIFPTLALAAPDSEASAYRLAPLTADQAHENLVKIEQAILTLENAPMPEDAPGFQQDFGSYYAAAWLAAWETLARFPDDPRAGVWSWKIPYYMTLAGESETAANIYAEKITAALNSGITDPVELETWFQSGELQNTIYTQSYVLRQTALNLGGQIPGFLIELGRLDDIDTPGSMCLLVVEKDKQYSTSLVYNGFLGVYQLIVSNPVNCTPKDVTGDGIDEIIVEQYTGGHYGTTTVQIFDVSSLTPKVMPFTSSNEQKLEIWNGSIVDYPTQDKKIQIEINEPVGDLNCDNYHDNFYQWNGKQFDLFEQKFHFGVSWDETAGSFCVDMALSNLYRLNPTDQIKFLELAIEAYWPRTTQLGDIYHELIIQKALAEAYANKPDQTRATLEGLTKIKGFETSIWSEPVQRFLGLYKQPTDLYPACSTLTACAPYRGAGNPGTCQETLLCSSSDALDFTLKSEFADIPLVGLTTKLKQIGVEIAAEGTFDFNQDQQPELWFTIPDEYGDFNLWVIMADRQGENHPFNLGYYEPVEPEPIFELETTSAGQQLVGFGEYEGYKIHLELDPVSGEPNLEWVDDDPSIELAQTIEQALDNFVRLRNLFLNGENPNEVYAQLQPLIEKGSGCPFELERTDGSMVSFYDCASYKFTLALAAELAGDQNTAIEKYYEVWKENSRFYNGLALLARLKLEK